MGEPRMSKKKNLDHCYSCENSVTFKKIKIPRYQYDESGLDNVFLINVPALECSSCKYLSVIIPKTEELHRSLAEAIVKKPFKLNGKEIRFLRTALGYSGTDFAREVNFKHEHLSKVENNHLPVSDELDEKVRLKYLCLKGIPKRTYTALQKAISEVLHPKEEGSKNVTLRLLPSGWKMPSAA